MLFINCSSRSHYTFTLQHKMSKRLRDHIMIRRINQISSALLHLDPLTCVAFLGGGGVFECDLFFR